jgi:hypothetical protein
VPAMGTRWVRAPGISVIRTEIAHDLLPIDDTVGGTPTEYGRVRREFYV